METKKMKFKRIIKNYDQYIQNKDSYTDFIGINVDLK